MAGVFLIFKFLNQMAQLFEASIYAIDGPGGGTSIANVQGQTNLFPVTGIRVYPKTVENQGAANATTVTVIEQLANGLNQPATKFYSTTPVATILADANAPLA